MNRIQIKLAISALLFASACAVVLFYPGQSNFPKLEEGKWQAVFLSNNQVYFGKIAEVNAEYVSLRNVYYLRTSSDLALSDSGQSLNLVKLGGELHGPEDLMYIPKKNIMFWENLKADSRVLKLIQTTISPLI